ncbi:MAG: hypothetical protein ACYTAN_01725 [Planctomycetota bacterium]|jgi:hypothetical protein
MSTPLYFDIEANLPDVTRKLDEFRRRQVPFATSRTLNVLALEAQEAVREGLPRRFKIRRRWVPLGVRARFSTKLNLESVVYDVDEFMLLQETGGVKRARGGHATALPRGVLGLEKRGDVAARVAPRSRRPRAMRQRSRVFVAPIEGGKARAIFWRPTRKRYPITFLWRLEPGAMRIKSRFEFTETVQGVVDRRADAVFGRELGRAIATAK